MRRNISDLLDSVEYSPLKTKTADLVSTEAISAKNFSTEKIKELTMSNMTRNTARRPGAARRKTLVAALVAAALLIALCGAAYATNAFRVRDYFTNVFASGEEIGKNDLQILKDYGVKEPLSVTSNGTTMTVTTAVYDGDSYFLGLNIVAPEGTVLDRGDWQWSIVNMAENSNLITDANGTPRSWCSGDMYSDDTPGDNEITLLVQIRSYGDMVFGDGTPKIIHIYGLWLEDQYGYAYKKVLDGEWDFDLERCGVLGGIPASLADGTAGGLTATPPPRS